MPSLWYHPSLCPTILSLVSSLILSNYPLVGILPHSVQLSSLWYHPSLCPTILSMRRQCLLFGIIPHSVQLSSRCADSAFSLVSSLTLSNYPLDAPTVPSLWYHHSLSPTILSMRRQSLLFGIIPHSVQLSSRCADSAFSLVSSLTLPTILSMRRQSLLFGIIPHSVQRSSRCADSAFSLVSSITLSNYPLDAPTVPSLWYHPSLCPTILSMRRQCLLFGIIPHSVQLSSRCADSPFSLVSSLTLSNYPLDAPTVPSLWYHHSLSPTILSMRRQSLLFGSIPHSVQLSSRCADSAFSLVSSLTLSNYPLDAPTVPSLWYHPSLCPTILSMRRQCLLFGIIHHSVQLSSRCADSAFSLVSSFTLSNYPLDAPTVPSLWYHPSLCPTILSMRRQSLLFGIIPNSVQLSSLWYHPSLSPTILSLVSSLTLSNYPLSGIIPHSLQLSSLWYHPSLCPTILSLVSSLTLSNYPLFGIIPHSVQLSSLWYHPSLCPTILSLVSSLTLSNDPLSGIIPHSVQLSSLWYHPSLCPTILSLVSSLTLSNYPLFGIIPHSVQLSSLLYHPSLCPTILSLVSSLTLSNYPLSGIIPHSVQLSSLWYHPSLCPTILSLVSSLTLSNYPLLLLLPCAFIYIALLPTWCSSTLITCAYIPLQPPFVYFLCDFPHVSCPIILSFLILSSFVTPHVHRSIRISTTSNLSSCATVLYTFPLIFTLIFLSHNTPHTLSSSTCSALSG